MSSLAPPQPDDPQQPPDFRPLSEGSAQPPVFGQPPHATMDSGGIPPSAPIAGGGTVPPSGGSNKWLIILAAALGAAVVAVAGLIFVGRDSGNGDGRTAADLLGEATATTLGDDEPPTTKPVTSPTPKPSVAPRPSVAAGTPCGPELSTFATGLTPSDRPLVVQLAPAGSDRRFDLILDAGGLVQIDVAMIDFDPMVELLDANATNIGFNDDGPLSADWRLTITATTSGFHTVVVSAFDPTTCAMFDVSINVVPTGSGGGNRGAAPTPPSVESFFGNLSSTPQAVEIALVAGDRLQLIVIDGGDGTDPFISLNDPSGAPLGSNDNGANATEGPLDARIDLVASSSGTFRAFLESANGVSAPVQITILIN
ncbi:MAG: hypothetical protein ACI8Y4_003088 [Candidatus Poriferisodalaceae bacterium]|jgi:hypothetical protein